MLVLILHVLGGALVFILAYLAVTLVTRPDMFHKYEILEYYYLPQEHYSHQAVLKNHKGQVERVKSWDGVNWYYADGSSIDILLKASDVLRERAGTL